LFQHRFKNGAVTDDLFKAVQRNIATSMPRATVAGNSLLDRVQKIFMVKWFGEKLQRSCLESPDTYGNITATGDENNGDLDIGLGQLLLQVKPTEPRQVHSHTKNRSETQTEPPKRPKKDQKTPRITPSAPVVIKAVPHF